MDLSALTNPVDKEPVTPKPASDLKSLLNEEPPDVKSEDGTEDGNDGNELGEYDSPSAERAGYKGPMKKGTSASTPGSGSGPRRYHPRSYHTLLTGSKVRHLKKKDGEPLWRADIQYDFLRDVFENDQKVFTNLYTKQPGNTFADIYIDAMARSSKTSKILREKLLYDRKASINMAMVCLLVNVGRMNTTLNFFPEMKAQLRTYHPIPSLQSYTEQEDQYKQLQDAPRLKSILKGACEDTSEPSTFDELAAVQGLPKSNPVNLIFLMSTYYPKVQYQYFAGSHDIFDLFMNRSLSSQSRAQAFLWLIWTYLESDGSPALVSQNPFGPGGSDGMKVPDLVTLSPDEIAAENVDPEIEIEFGAKMTKERFTYLEQANAATLSAAEAVMIRSTDGSIARIGNRWVGRSPRGASAEASTPVSTRSLRARDSHPDYRDSPTGDEEAATATPSRPGRAAKTTASAAGRSRRGGRPAVVEVRARKCQVEIERILTSRERQLKRARYEEGSIARTWKRIKTRDPLYDSDDESLNEQQPPAPEPEAFTATTEPNTGPNGIKKEPAGSHLAPATPSASNGQAAASTHPALTSVPQPPPHLRTRSRMLALSIDDEDYGEEMNSIARSLRRAIRWTRRWQSPQKISLSKDLKRHSISVMKLDNVLDSQR